LLLLDKITEDDKPTILQHTVHEFHGNGITDDEISYFTKTYTDWELSRKLSLDGALAGFYLLHEGSITDLMGKRYETCIPLEDLSGYKHKRGVEGIILLVLPEHRGKGFGNILKALPRQMGYDYVYGEQFKCTPDVLQHWLKRRRLIADCAGTYGDVWVTIEDF
jgi:GNAT superfamily N-acetyltransferase